MRISWRRWSMDCRRQPVSPSASTGWSCWPAVPSISKTFYGRPSRAPRMSDMDGSRISRPTVQRTARSGRELAAAGAVSEDKIADIERVAERYAVAVTPDMLALMDPADPKDPIARQFIPDAAEL